MVLRSYEVTGHTFLWLCPLSHPHPFHPPYSSQDGMGTSLAVAGEDGFRALLEVGNLVILS